MADKGKGKNTGKSNSKKPKNQKVGQRPHEVREREALQKAAPLAPLSSERN